MEISTNNPFPSSGRAIDYVITAVRNWTIIMDTNTPRTIPVLVITGISQKCAYAIERQRAKGSVINNKFSL